MALFKMFDKDVKRLKELVAKADKIDALKDEMAAMSDEQLQAKTVEFRKRLDNGETLDDILVEAFAVVREADKRILGLFPYKVQLMGGVALHNGDIAEMRTGEGKTLTETLPTYLNGLSGDGVHIITVNEYLSERDFLEMGPVFKFLGLTVGLNKRELSPAQKHQQYLCDITYTTNSEVGFDYLKDNMVTNLESKVLRSLNYAIVDEVDSILIDESRTPLIISGGAKQTANLYLQADNFTKSLGEHDYLIDIKAQAIQLTETGINKAERFFKLNNLYDLEHTALVHHINQSLRANYIMIRDVHYMVGGEKNDEIIIIDQFTGRQMEGRTFSEGLHQAIEAKERVTIKEETTTLATITYQNFFRLYNKLSGMTGTAKTEEEEFKTIYNMRVIPIPTNRPIRRQDDNDAVFATKKAKFKALSKEIERRHKLGQPILVGTADVDTSELVSRLLQRRGIAHEVLNAKNHSREAQIIANAGKKGAVTIATNMAGRGTDIKLGLGVADLGGLAVLGSERHESRRIDNQLRGRSGRQGDVGYSKFYVSMEDNIIKRFATDSLKGMFAKLGDEAIEMKSVTKSIEQAQKRVEGHNFDARKQVLQYDDVLRQQREIVYNQRDEILEGGPGLKNLILGLIHDVAEIVINENIEASEKEPYVNIDRMFESLEQSFLHGVSIDKARFKGLSITESVEMLETILTALYEQKNEMLPIEIQTNFAKVIFLKVLDNHWIEHLDTMTKVRDGIYLRAYAQKNPLQEYTQEGYALFEYMLASVAKQTVLYLLRAQIQQQPAPTPTGPSIKIG